MPEFLPPVSSSSTTDYYRPVEVFVVQPPKQRYWLHIVLLLATIFTTLVVGARMEFNFQHNQPAFSLNDDDVPFFPLRWILAEPSRLLLGLPFASTLMLILLAHEMGHYLCCRYYGVNATLPFFIPAPTLIGTLGAFIRIRSPIRSRAALFDIGIAGPIAGFVVAVTVLIFAMPLSKTMSPAMASPDIQLGYPLIFRLAWYVLPLASAEDWLVCVALDLFSSHCDCGLGGNVRNRAQSFAGWPTRWRTHRLLARSARAQDSFAIDDSCAHSDGTLFLGGVADLGNSPEDQRHASSHGGGMAGSDGRAAMDCRIRSRHADSYLGARTFCT